MATFFKDMFAPGRVERSEGSEDKAKTTASSSSSNSKGGSSTFLSELFSGTSSSSNRAEVQEIYLAPFRTEDDTGEVPAELLAFFANHNSSKPLTSSHSSSSSAHVSSLESTAIVDQRYFQDNFDCVESVLATIPDGDAQEMSILTTLGDLREKEALVGRELFKVVQQNYEALVEGMRQVQSIDMDVTRALVNVKNARRRMQNAQNDLVKGDLEIVQLHRRRTRSKQLIKTLQELDKFIVRKRELDQATLEGCTPKAVQICLETLESLDNRPVPNDQPDFKVLLQLRNNLVNYLPELRKRNDTSLRDLCIQATPFQDETYKSILRSYCLLDAAISFRVSQEKQDLMQRRSSLFRTLPPGTDLTDGVVGLALRVQKIAIQETELAIKAQLVSFLADVSAKKKADQVVEFEANAAQDAPKDVTVSKETTRALHTAKAKELALKDLCDQLPLRESARPSLVRRIAMAYEKTCEVLCTYDRICKWHEHFVATIPHDNDENNMQVNNKDISPLFDALGLSDQDAGRFYATFFSKLPTDAVISMQRFTFLEQELSAGRHTVWSGILSHIATLTRSPALAYPVLNLHAFDNFVKLTDIMASISQAFGGDTCVLEIRAFLRDLCKSYSRDFHKDHVEALHSFLTREQWHMLRVPLSSLGGAKGLVQRGMAKHFFRSSSVEEDDQIINNTHEIVKSKSSTMESFHGDGNPFSSLAVIETLDEDPDQTDAPLKEPALSTASFTTSVDATETQDSAVLTTTLVNCIAKDVGSYLALMKRVPPVAAEVFVKLQSLINIYIFDIITNLADETVLFELFSKNEFFSKRFPVLKKAMLSICEDLGASTYRVRVIREQASPSNSKKDTRLGRQSSAKAFVSAVRSGPSGLSTRRKASAPMVGASDDSSSSSSSSPSTSQNASSSPVFPSAIPKPLVELAGAHKKELDPQGVLNIRVKPKPHNEAIHGQNMVVRIVAAESISFVLLLLDSVRKDMEQALPAVERAQLSKGIFDELGETASQFTLFMQRSVARALVNQFGQDSFASNVHRTNSAETTTLAPMSFGGSVFGFIPQAICNSVQWSSVKVTSEANAYVGNIVMRMRKIWAHLQRESKEGAQYPLAAITPIWYACLHECMEQLLDGFASVQSCSLEGLGLMLVDAQTLFSDLKDIGPVDPEASLCKQKVDDYIKAMHFKRGQDVLEWVEINKSRYDLWHLNNLAVFTTGAAPQSDLLRNIERSYLKVR